MKIVQKALVSKMISSSVADIEIHTHEVNKGLWQMIAVECNKTMASAVTFVQAALRSVSVMQLPGYGQSRFNIDAASVTLDDYLSAIDMACPSDNAVLYGYSHGGYFMTQYALLNAGKVRALVLVEPALFSAKQDLLQRAALIDDGKEVESMASMVKTVESEAGRSEDQLRQLATQLVANVNSGVAVAQEYRIRAEHVVSEEDLAKLDIPVLLIAGTKSHASFMVKRAFQAIPHATVCWIQGASHLDLEKVENVQQIARAIDNFLESVDGDSGTGFKNLIAELNSSGVATAPVELIS